MIRCLLKTYDMTQVATLEWRNDPYLVSTDKSKIDIGIVYGFLVKSYWAENIPKETVLRSIENSLCFGVYERDKLIGFARVITDFATFAYLADVFILDEKRGLGLSKWLIKVIVDHPNLQRLRRFILATKDAHGLYARFGFTPFDQPQRWMMRYDPYVYKERT